MTDDLMTLVISTVATARIVAEEKLDAELAADIRLRRTTATLSQVKQQLIDSGRLYRLKVRGRNYLAAIPIIGEVHGLQICHRWQTVTLLESLAELFA